jgi:CubicO group peptidase (beta-lactamase class C family)
MSDSSMLETNDALDRTLREPIGGIETPGLVVAICDRTGILWHHARGHADAGGDVPVDLDALFCIGSVTKSFTAQAILILRDEGALSLDEPLRRSVPEADTLKYPTRDSLPITLRHLLTHTSGLPRGVRDLRRTLGREPDEGELLDHLAMVTLERAPGIEDSYSNLGYALLGIVVQRCSGQPFDAFITERILAPLSMITATFHPERGGARLVTAYKERRSGGLRPNEHQPMRAYDPAGGLCASARELARFISFQLDAWPPRDDPESGLPLRRATVRESHRVGGHQRIGLGKKGLGWSILRDAILREVVWRNGATSGYNAYAGFEPDLGIGILGLANADTKLERPLEATLGAFAIARGLVQDRPR